MNLLAAATLLLFKRIGHHTICLADAVVCLFFVCAWCMRARARARECGSDEQLQHALTTMQGDACSLDLDALGGGFDGVVAANLLCRLPEPRAFLEGMQAAINPGGTLVLISP